MVLNHLTLSFRNPKPFITHNEYSQIIFFVDYVFGIQKGLDECNQKINVVDNVLLAIAC